MKRVLRQNRLDAEDRLSRALPFCSRSFLDALDQAFNALLIGFLGEMPPTGKRRELDGHFLGVAEAVEVLSPPARRILLAAVEPVAGEGLAVEDGSNRVDSRPVPDPLDKILFATLGESVLQPLDLSFFFWADDDRLIAAGEDRYLPTGQTVDLSRQVRAQVLHEVGDFF